MIKKALHPDPDPGDPILVHDSKATCPECNSAEVDLGQTGNGYVVYNCKNCERMWVNDADALVK